MSGTPRMLPVVCNERVSELASFPLPQRRGRGVLSATRVGKPNVPHMEVSVRDNTAVVPVRRRRSIFSIIGMIVVALVVAVVAYFAWVGWSGRGRPVSDVDVKTTSSAGGAAIRNGLPGRIAAATAPRRDPEVFFGIPCSFCTARDS